MSPSLCFFCQPHTSQVSCSFVGIVHVSILPTYFHLGRKNHHPGLQHTKFTRNISVQAFPLSLTGWHKMVIVFCRLLERFFVVTGFDPWDESSKALADLIEKETVGGSAVTSSAFMGGFPTARGGNPPPPPPGLHNHIQQQQQSGLQPPQGPPPPSLQQQQQQQQHHNALAKNLPPGITPNHLGAFNTSMPPPPPSGQSSSLCFLRKCFK